MRFLIWDFDGTICDSFAAIRAASREAWTENDLPPVADDLLRSIIGLGLTPAFQRMLESTPGADPDNEALVAAVVASYKAAWSRNGTDQLVLFDGMAELLKELSDGGVPMAIATSKGRTGADEALAALGIAGYFDPVVTFSDVEHGKPHPEMVLVACAARGVEPADAVVIGDTSFDIGMGRSAGATTVAVTWGNQALPQLNDAHPTHVVDDVPALRELLRHRFC